MDAVIRKEYIGERCNLKREKSAAVCCDQAGIPVRKTSLSIVGSVLSNLSEVY